MIMIKNIKKCRIIKYSSMSDIGLYFNYPYLSNRSIPMQPEQQQFYTKYSYSTKNTNSVPCNLSTNISYFMATDKNNRGSSHQSTRQSVKQNLSEICQSSTNYNSFKYDNSNSVKINQHQTQKSQLQQNNNIFLNKTEKALGTLHRITQWRKDNIAPVDTVGCEVLYDKNEQIQIQKYQVLIALILSVQTKDQTTGKVMQKLKQYGLKPEKMAAMEEQKLRQLIRQSNFNRKKAKNIIEVSKRIMQSGLPKTKQQLMEYPGVGIKIALLYMRTAENVNDGIGVDTHVHRISNRLGWVQNTKNPIQTQSQLQRLFPKSEWNHINIALVGFGQIQCSAKKPMCNKCPVKGQCPSSYTNSQFLF